MSVRGLLFFITILFLSWPSSCRAQTEETCKKTMIYHQYSQHVLATPSWAPLPPPSQPVRSTPAGSQKKFATFVVVTITLMKAVTLATNSDVEVSITIGLLVSPTLLGNLLILLLLPPLLLLMSRQ
ncbi:hypothetical protein Acr_25g0006300 [Actinidia rufa]|uniref:Uncharacterized protein n=1 Tax=Actinidia rufa TaxID=165716 RepID=A0A7J0GZL7_9ERIC|nr:hypothetical protein Acr_25g0006300 [Actinidia rufa]